MKAVRCTFILKYSCVQTASAIPTPSTPPPNVSPTSLTVFDNFYHFQHQEYVWKLVWVSVQVLEYFIGFGTTRCRNYTVYEFLKYNLSLYISWAKYFVDKTPFVYRYLKRSEGFSYTDLLYTIFMSLYSRKLHIFGFRARTVVIRSRVIFFFSFWLEAVYHFCSLSLPWRLNSNINWN